MMRSDTVYEIRWKPTWKNTGDLGSFATDVPLVSNFRDVDMDWTPKTGKVVGKKAFPDDILTFGNLPSPFGLVVTNEAARTRIDAMNMDGYRWCRIDVLLGKVLVQWLLMRVTRFLDVVDMAASEPRRFVSGRKELGLIYGGDLVFNDRTPRRGVFAQVGEPWIGTLVGPESAEELIAAKIRGLVLDPVGRM